VVWENFAEFVDLDTGQEGLGVEEHMRGG